MKMLVPNHFICHFYCNFLIVRDSSNASQVFVSDVDYPILQKTVRCLPTKSK